MLAVGLGGVALLQAIVMRACVGHSLGGGVLLSQNFRLSAILTYCFTDM